VHVPQVGSDGRAVPPTLANVPADALADIDTPWTKRYAAFTGDPRATALRVVALELTEDQYYPLGDVPYADGTPEHRAITAAGTNISRWFDIVRTWIELLTAQDLDHRHPVYDANSIGPGFEAWRDGAFVDVGFTLTTPRINALSLDNWRYALDEAAHHRYPPVQYVTARDARAASIRGDHRKAILDAATSAEVVLAQVYDQEWPKYAKEPPHKRPALDAYAKWLLSKGVTLAVEEARIDELRNARNSAIHSGTPTTEAIAYNAVETAYRLAVTHTPL
jgi:hypothetical protein